MQIFGCAALRPSNRWLQVIELKKDGSEHSNYTSPLSLLTNLNRPVMMESFLSQLWE